jgi:hypothetical protein
MSCNKVLIAVGVVDASASRPNLAFGLQMNLENLKIGLRLAMWTLGIGRN